MLTGIDVSHHQGSVTWTRVKGAGHDFAFCKATDGTSYPFTNYYLANVSAIRAAGLVPGAYHWLRAGPNGELRDARGQARYFRSIIGPPDGLLCALDVESLRNSNGALISAPRIDSVRAFADEWRTLSGGHPLIVYTGRWYWVDHIGNPTGVDIGPLWHSEYETSAGEVADGPELDNYGKWPGCTFWQYTSGGSVPGVSGSCDVNQYHGGGLSDLLALTTAGDDPMTEAEWLRMSKVISDTLDITIRQIDKIAEAYHAPSTAWSGNLPGRVDRVFTTFKDVTTAEANALFALTADAIADAVWAKRPPGTDPSGITLADIKGVVREVFAEVRYTVDPADVIPTT
jgi:GH25 family lysozyme M1 (1,4-beta-N-acetylmuramidase)